MSSIPHRYLALGLVASLGLSACMDASNGTASRENASANMSTEFDVEDESVFSKRENGLWDGRPSLGGVWVAHPEVTGPERVIIRNTDSGQETIGALFRRERENPGPRFQVSAEAANAVGILAGAPTMIEVVALRTQEIAPEPEAAEAPADSDAPLTTDDARIALPGTEVAPEPEAEPRRGLLSRIFGGRQQPEPEPEPAPPAEGEIETATLDGDAPAEADAPPPMPSPQPQDTAPAPASTLDRPMIQLGIFSVEGNANNAADMAREAGLSARVVTGSAQGNDFWRVVAGPASSSAERSRMLERVQALGFNDAYAVRR
ncbi:MAG: SPOR domain-containing protein [Rhodobacteraceae bacterium]|nr:SPOR domain-containing protein [Paracoccaceae bacterium]